MTVLVDDYTPMSQGATLPVLQWTFQTTLGAAIDLTSATLTLYLYDPDSNQFTQGVGSWNILSPAANGQANYTWGAADTQNPFDGFLIVRIQNSNGIYFIDPKPFKVVPLFFAASGDSPFV